VKQLNIRDPDSLRLAQVLVFETVRRQNFIDKFINKTLKPETLDEYNLGVQSFLRLYVYQTRIARNWSKINIREAENIAKTARSILGWQTLQKVEPILGYLLTRGPETVFESMKDEERIAFETFHPAWWVKYCIRLFGRPTTLDLLKADTQKPPTYIRINTLTSDEETILKKLAEEGTQVEKIQQLQHAFKLVNTKVALTKTASFREGDIYVQDKASCFAAEAADPQPGMTVLDVCAAPGAKTTYLAQLMHNQGLIYSADYSKRRMKVWKTETKRMKAEIAEPVIADARFSIPIRSEADVVILDPPCTSTGTFRKSPSAKWRLTPRSIEHMTRIQWQMLDNSAEHVKPGGTLVYSTCAITVEENEMLIERFLKFHLDFDLSEINPKIGASGLRGLENCRRLYPHVDDCNGFFIARLTKEKL
jgi:16S rRNA (cytosine967-C5)-methyltransferase